ncbi:GntR family transcriptional regulator [Amaricoccus solimangrovi]|uniref:GntR family transcriptional regulator n=1 Tax=Amaricoccus solimangrovi TaxID=2589815 RepID=A0A501WTE3_9RHOB|nr:GntR family transcriptional regulator [Amaricoccus solimangrovi]TPE51374.1 GntR family transcriptional regulator [Amaricoccus solimangrovi]
MLGSRQITAAAPEPAPSEEIAVALARGILEHRLPPGARLSEDEVGELFGAGRTVVRAALARLAHQGLVTLRRNRGASVARPDPREAREVFEARALLEPRTAHFAARRAGPGWAAEMRARIAEEDRAMRAGDVGTAVYLSGQFHCAIAEAADQRTIAEMIVSLVARSSLVIALYWRRRDTLCECHAHHALVDAFAARDGARAEELMHGHLVDLLSGLDLREREAAPRSLRDLLGGGT